LQGADRDKPLVLDLRSCMGGTMAEAAQAGGLLASGPLATVQEAGGRETAHALVPGGLEPFKQVALLVGAGTLGTPEALASALKKAGMMIIGERTAGLGVERTRILLRQGGALELVTKRWLGPGGEKLDRQGVVPDKTLRGLKPDEDPLPKVLPLLEAKQEEASKASKKVADLLGSLRVLVQAGEVA
jgi:carboxyl-terminal processing protease